MIRLCYKCIQSQEHQEHEIVSQSEYNIEIAQKFHELSCYLNEMEELEHNAIKAVESSCNNQKLEVSKAAETMLNPVIETLVEHEDLIVNELYNIIDLAAEQEIKRVLKGIINDDSKQNFKDLKERISKAIDAHASSNDVQHSVNLLNLHSNLPKIESWSLTTKGKEITRYEYVFKSYFKKLQTNLGKVLADLTLDKIESIKTKIFINTITGPYTIQYFNNPTVRQLSDLIVNQKNVRMPFTLYYCGKQLSDDLTLEDYGMGPDSTLEMKLSATQPQDNKNEKKTLMQALIKTTASNSDQDEEKPDSSGFNQSVAPFFERTKSHPEIPRLRLDKLFN